MRNGQKKKIFKRKNDDCECTEDDAPSNTATRDTCVSKSCTRVATCKRPCKDLSTVEIMICCAKTTTFLISTREGTARNKFNRKSINFDFLSAVERHEKRMFFKARATPRSEEIY